MANGDTNDEDIYKKRKRFLCSLGVIYLKFVPIL